MFNALQNPQSTKIQNYTGEKVVIMISKDTPNEVNINTPYLYPNYTTANVKEKRGGVSGGKVLITEEVMCTPGGPVDQIRREFDQVVHEMAHAIDNVCNLKTSESTYAAYLPAETRWEWIAWTVQTWFNSSQANGPNLDRSTIAKTEKDYLGTVFNPNNSWIPPRWLRNR